MSKLRREVIVAAGKLGKQAGSQSRRRAPKPTIDGNDSTYQSRALMWPSSRPMSSISNSGQRGVLDELVDGILSKQALGNGEGGRMRGDEELDLSADKGWVGGLGDFRRKRIELRNSMGVSLSEPVQEPRSQLPVLSTGFTAQFSSKIMEWEVPNTYTHALSWQDVMGGSICHYLAIDYLILVSRRSPLTGAAAGGRLPMSTRLKAYGV